MYYRKKSETADNSKYENCVKTEQCCIFPENRQVYKVAQKGCKADIGKYDSIYFSDKIKNAIPNERRVQLWMYFIAGDRLKESEH